MSSNVLIVAVSLIMLGAAAVFLWMRWVYLRREQEKYRVDLLHKYYEVTLLNSLMSRMGENLDFSVLVHQVVATCEKYYPMSLATYVIYEKSKLNYFTRMRESLPSSYIEEAKRQVLNSFGVVANRDYRDLEIHEPKQEFKSNESLTDAKVESSFLVPVAYGGEIIGLIGLTSRNKNAFSSADMRLLYDIVKRVTKAYIDLESYIATQRRSMNALMSGHPGGAMYFSMVENDLKLQYINPSARKFLKIDDETALSVLSTFAPEYNVVALLREAVHEQKCLFVSEVKVHDKFFKLFINPVFNEGTAGVSITMQDVTIEKEIESVRDNFMHTIVHELRAPLTSIKGSSELLLKGQLDSEQKSKMLNMIHGESERMLGEIGDILDAAQIESGKLSVELKMGNIMSLVSSRIEAFSYLASEKQLSIKSRLAEADNFAFDPIRIAEVVNNLISNSIKYSHPGGEILVTSEVQGERYIVHVSDRGIGIPEDKKTKLFSKFGQVHGGRSGSSGLGLFIAKGIVASHNGQIWVDSENGVGTTVSFYLPMTKVVTTTAGISQDSQYLSKQRMVN